MRTNFKLFLTIFFLSACWLSTALGQTQSFDYEEQPTFDFRFTEAKIDLKVNPKDGSISGSVLYSLKANINGADTLRLDARGLAIDSVLSKGKSLKFSTEKKGLQVVLADSSEMGAPYQLEIFYHSKPQFGILKSSEGTIWTSMLPRSTSHWLPVKDHPRVEMITTLSLQIPAPMTAFASGVRTDSEVLSTSSKKITFRSGRSIPITTLAFGLGQLREEGSSMGIKQINSYAEVNTVTAAKQKKLVKQSKSLLAKIEQATGMDYPYQRLNIVILNDHYWEQKPYGASTVFLYKNRGDLENQLRRGLYGQWFGVFLHEEQWANSWPIFALQVALHYKISDANARLRPNRAEPATKFSTVYDQFSADRWNFWQQSQFWDPNAKQIGARLVPEILQQGSGIITPNSFQSAWYQISGQPAITPPDYTHELTSTTSLAMDDTLRYRVDYQKIKDANKLKLVFKKQEGAIQKPLRLPLRFMTTQGVDSTGITVTGAKDSVSVSIPAGTRGVYLDVPQDRPIILEEHKSVSFLLYQLRNAKTTEARKNAALQLGYHTDNPDLQLALNDVMKQDMAPEVEAALLRSYGKITAGDMGTQQRFIEALSSESKAKRSVALDILGNYDSEEVTQRLRSFSQKEQSNELSNRALKMYLGRIDSTTALEFTNTLVQQDTSGTKAIVAIEALGASGNSTKAVKLASFYIRSVYEYSVRKQAFQILLANDTSADSWKKRVKMLLKDFDPRIRYLTVKNISKIPGIDAKALLKSHREHEYDARVLRAMSRK